MNKKRFTAVLLILCLIVPLFAMPACAESSTELEAIMAMGIMIGDENGNLNLSDNVTRAQFTKMAVMASSFKDSVGSISGATLFKDVVSGYWAGNYIKIGVEQGWISGYSDGTFRPNNNITLEEACSILLRMLGYSSSSLTGTYPTAQLSKASSVGLRDDLSATQGQILTRGDCVTLFYNLMTSTASNGAVYGQALGYDVSNGEISYASIVSKDTKGPFVAETGVPELPFDAANASYFRNGTPSSAASIQPYDVYYYNSNLNTVWTYSDRVSGTIASISPNTVSPVSIVVGSTVYQLGTSTAIYKCSSKGDYDTGSVVTLLLGMDGEVVDVVDPSTAQSSVYGVVISCEKAVSDSSLISTVMETKIVCTDGTLRSYQFNTAKYTVGKAVSVSVDEDGVHIKHVSSKDIKGTVNSKGTSFAGLDFSDDIQILEIDDFGNYARIYPSRLAKATLNTENVVFYSLNEYSEIDRLILKNTTGDLNNYVYITSFIDSSSDSSLSVNATYVYFDNGVIGSVATNGIVYAASAGGASMTFSNGSLAGLHKLASAKITSLDTLTAMSGSKKYAMDENVKVIFIDGGKYYATDLDSINTSDYTLTGWYDSQGYSAGGRIRIITAVKKSN